jgi:hypothetical protein
MAKSKLIANRKKSTVVVSKRSLEDAIRRANVLASSWMESNPSDPRLEQVENIVTDLSRYLKMTPQEMRQDGVSTVEEYFDDAVRPDIAQRIKSEVNQVAKWHDEARAQHAQPAEVTPERMGVDYVPEHATVMSSEEEKDMADKKANNAGGAGFVTDRNEQGEAKMPEKVEVPRLARKKVKKEAEDPAMDAAAPVPPVPPTPPAPAAAAPAPASTGGVNAIDYIPTETLIKVIGDLPKEDDFAQNQGKQDALIELTNVLKSRPVLPPEPVEGGEAAPAPAAAAPAAPAGAIPPPVTASKKADYGDHRMDSRGTVNSGSGASSQIGQGGSSAAPEQISTNPQPNEAKIDLGGLTIASEDLEEKTAEDYRIHDYKLLDNDEGIMPQGRLPNMDEQEQHMHPEGEMGMDASMEKEAVTPPGISEETMHKLKKEYPGDKSKAYATAWSIHNKQESLKAAAQKFVEEVAKIASAGGSGGWFVDGGEPMEVDEDGGRTPEIAQAHAGLEDNTSITRPATTAPIKLNQQQSLKTAAGDMSTSSALKKSESLGNDLKMMYLEAKSLTQINDTRAVREAVESIFRAGDMMDNALKALGKQHEQEENEAAAQEIKAKNKKSNVGGLALAAAE